MKIFIAENETDFEKLASSLARTPRATAATLERVKALNPHLADVTRLPKGSVLILPDGADLKTGAGSTVVGVNPGELGERFSSSLRSVASRASERLESINADRSAARDALKSAAAKRLVENDALLQKRLAAAETQFKTEQKRASEVRAEIAERSEAAKAEFVRVQKLFG